MRELEGQHIQVVPAIMPINLAAGAQAGDVVSLKNYNHLAIYVLIAAGGAAEPVTITVEQCTDVAAAGAKALNFTRYKRKQAALLNAVGTYTEVTQAAGNTCSKTGDVEGLFVIEFNAEDLDVQNGFDCVRVSLSDPGNTSQIGGAWYNLCEARFAQDTLLSAIAN